LGTPFPGVPAGNDPCPQDPLADFGGRFAAGEGKGGERGRRRRRGKGYWGRERGREGREEGREGKGKDEEKGWEGVCVIGVGG